MKLIRWGEAGKEKPGVLLNDGAHVDVSQFVPDYDERFFEEDGIDALRLWLARNESTAPRVSTSMRLGPPICRPSKIICIGLNYRDHAAESGAEAPREPVLFMKATSSLVGPNDPVVIPRNAEKLDWEVELAVVIGKKATYIAKEQALKFVAGYALHNDYSERSFQLERGGQWVKGKSADTFAPIGPFLATRDEVPEPGRLGMWLKVNKEFRQTSN
jgi:2-keto-4-pentenoate hydratase/2-oxohepta-3-ene-1,7-dioic acid hydratase in catechol pathway